MDYTDRIKEHILETRKIKQSPVSRKQEIALQHMKLLKMGEKDSEEAKELRRQYRRLEGEKIVEKKDWMQGAVKRPGRCTPMPNPDCPVGSPQYNLGKRFKKAARKKKRKGGTGWQGKV